MFNFKACPLQFQVVGILKCLGGLQGPWKCMAKLVESFNAGFLTDFRECQFVNSQNRQVTGRRAWIVFLKSEVLLKVIPLDRVEVQ